MCDDTVADAAALLIIYTCFDMENKKQEKKKIEKKKMEWRVAARKKKAFPCSNAQKYGNAYSKGL